MTPGVARTVIHTMLALIGADHFDGPGVLEDPATDIADVYAWMSTDATKVNLVLDITAARFSDAVQYVFQLESSAAFGQKGTEQNLICQFSVDQTVQCWLTSPSGEEYASGDASG